MNEIRKKNQPFCICCFVYRLRPLREMNIIFPFKSCTEIFSKAEITNYQFGVNVGREMTQLRL